ncbi:MAG: hypothetical protein WC710_14735 [Gallionella sp.]|jgi:hypothetical protein
MSHCHIHNCNNCIECALEKQTNAIIDAIERMDKPNPMPPPNRQICDTCGDITTTGHTGWICRLVAWVNRLRGSARKNGAMPDDFHIIGYEDTLVLVYKCELKIEVIDRISTYFSEHGIRAAVVVGCDEIYIKRNYAIAEAGKAVKP